MSDDDDRTVVLAPLARRKVCTTWAEIVSREELEPVYSNEKPACSYLGLFDLNPDKRTLFYFPIPENKALQVGKCSFLPDNVDLLSVSLLEIDPGCKLGESGIVVWKNEDPGALCWCGQCLFVRVNGEWVKEPAKSAVQILPCNDLLRGLLSPWWGFILKGVGPSETRIF
ncbi:MAG TPA: hypothetical protein VKM55_00475 [Candidatus Lokiarchaeia archaeon]|nr:hypothetical protein [Candidatus Lokiarchaeia archaeon]